MGLISKTKAVLCVMLGKYLLRKTASSPIDSSAIKQTKSIAILAGHWLGDTLWAAQTMPHLRSAFPDAKITVFTKPQCADLWSGALAVDEIIPTGLITSDMTRENISLGALKNLGAQYASHFDMTLDLMGNRFSALFSLMIGAKFRCGFGGQELSAAYNIYVKDGERKGRHLCERPFRVIEPLIGEYKGSQKIIPPAPIKSAGEACGEYGFSGRRVAVIAPGAGWRAKEWGDHNFAATAALLAESGMAIAITGSLSEKERCAKIADSVNAEHPGSAFIVCEKTPVNIISILSGCEIFIGNDSGLGHISAAFGRRTGVIFTDATNPEICGPLGDKAIVFSKNAEPREVIEKLTA
ncbi:MAG: glycosyltransferase family 9 protein [Planctomycetes bacterium]|nr:glycosyltransferase family 9 protein [Planctomycetota bacterium]